MSPPSRSLLDTFVLRLDRCRARRRRRSGGVVKCTHREPTTSITDKKRRGGVHLHITPIKEGGREKM